MHSSLLSQRVPFTSQEFARMQREVCRLSTLREEVLGRLKTAREMGDLSENGAYKYAKFELGNISRELRRLRQLIHNGVVVQKQAANGKVAFGSVVTIKSDTRTMIFTLVSEFESNPTKGKLSMKSPIGVAVFGKNVGDAVVIRTPSGDVQYHITTVA